LKKRGMWWSKCRWIISVDLRAPQAFEKVFCHREGVLSCAQPAR
jgi:hypothetical protein